MAEAGMCNSFTMLSLAEIKWLFLLWILLDQTNLIDESGILISKENSKWLVPTIISWRAKSCQWICQKAAPREKGTRKLEKLSLKAFNRRRSSRAGRFQLVGGLYVPECMSCCNEHIS
ncbi:histone acetyltransferase KAT6A [Striga asiatica]|uniref:Histone acetyltransferase KAT6A n=1 Tax=Striga asiatica TaxID=4170 RepID=A0A5A7RCW9_STRAF|nr:histone acetyltransferase KAT6A [Striga asiatica]